MKITAVFWDSTYPMASRLSKSSRFECSIHSQREIDGNPSKKELLEKEISASDVIILHRTTNAFWDDVLSYVKGLEGKKVVCFGQDVMSFSYSTVDKDIPPKVYDYVQNADECNIANMFRFLENKFIDPSVQYEDVKKIPWQGIVHPNNPAEIFPDTESFLSSYGRRDRPLIGLIVSRSAWITRQYEIETEMISKLEERGFGVVPIMTNSLHNESAGSMNITECIKSFLIRDGKPVVKALIKMVTFMIGKKPGITQEQASKESTGLLELMDIPIFQPIIAYWMTTDEWEKSNGIGIDIPWCVTMPEFEGAIEPMIIGTTADNDSGYCRKSIPGRCTRYADRIARRLHLRDVPNNKKRLVLILNNSPCASAEANIGSAAGLDTMRSVFNILNRLKADGYRVDVPESSDALIRMFREKKAHSEFRWTSKEAIVASGGAIYMMPLEQYVSYFDGLPEKVRNHMTSSWGEPPGESMVVDGRIVITGLNLGNVIVAVQPKRGCYGAKCDGTVCKMLHDPECPPSHQYLATYMFFGDIFKADALVHVGTHGTAEFLPGKGIGLSENCYPDVTIGDMPIFYVYNTDNPPEASVAKRRIYSTLVGHMQAPTDAGFLYGPYKRLDELVTEYEMAKSDPAHAHSLHHEIVNALQAAGVYDDYNITDDTLIEDIIPMCHESLTLMRNSRWEKGMHTFGELFSQEDETHLVGSILRYPQNGLPALAEKVATAFDTDYGELTRNKGGFDVANGKSNGALMQDIHRECERIVSDVISGDGIESIAEAHNIDKNTLAQYTECILRIHSDLRSTDEIGSLIHALNCGFVSPGPSGYISRGRADIIPTGRNIYSMDPKRIPTRTAWKIGTRLADALLDKYMDDEGRYPESVAFQWMTTDIMAAEGEMMAEILSLLGCEPEWSGNGQVTSFRIVPKEKLVHPRIDVTARISGILRDTFPDRLDLIDSAVKAVASLDESYDANFIRKHVDQSKELGLSEDESTARLFSSKPGTYTSGVNLAILSGTWKDEKDLAEIYIAVNGYAYGGGREGTESHVQFANSLETVELTFNKVISDDHDLLGCCCYYSNQGGMTAAARHLSGKKVNTYYGDTREAEDVGVRTLSEEIRRVTRSKLLNPEWIEGMKKHGYKGAADMMKKITRVYGWKASTREVDDAIFDDIASTYVNDEKMKEFFRDNNPYAAEEISRRLIEAENRGLWNADQKVLDELVSSYVEIESWMEEMSDDDDVQGGEAPIMSPDEVEPLAKDIVRIMQKVHSIRRA